MSAAQVVRRSDGGSDPGPDAVLRALADPHRRHMLKLVQTSELAAGQIATHFDITQQAVSQHLRVLERAGPLPSLAEETRRLYLLRPESLEPARAVLDDLWPEALERLKRAVEQGKRQKKGQDGR